MTENMRAEMDDLTERATHCDTMKFTSEDAERLTYLEMAAEVYRLERKAIEKENGRRGY